MTAIYDYLPNLLDKKSTVLLDKIKENNKKIGYLPTTVEKFVEFSEDVNVISN